MPRVLGHILGYTDEVPLVRVNANAIKSIVVVCAISMPVACAADDTQPTVLRTVPENGARDVDPTLSELSVTFSERMRNGNWSWVYENKASFPQMLGHPRFVDDLTRNVLPVRLEPNKDYVIWLNSDQFTNFKDEAGNPALPFKLTFRTRPAGK